MEKIEFFDKNGSVVNLGNAITDYLKDNLTVQVRVNTIRNFDFGKDHNEIEINVLLNDEVISKDCDSIYNI